MEQITKTYSNRINFNQMLFSQDGYTDHLQNQENFAVSMAGTYITGGNERLDLSTKYQEKNSSYF